MQRISTPTRFIDKFGPGKDGFTDGNPATGLSTTQLEAIWFDSEQEEIANVIEFAGIPLNPADHTQLWQAINAIASGAGAGLYVAKAGDTMTGSLAAPNFYATADVSAGGLIYAANDISCGGNMGAGATISGAYIRSAGSIDAVQNMSAAGMYPGYLLCSGQIDAGATINSQNGRILSNGGQPSIGCHIPGTAAAGMWMDPDRFQLGAIDGTGNPQTGWAYFLLDGTFGSYGNIAAGGQVSAGYLYSSGNIDAAGSVGAAFVNASQNIGASGSINGAYIASSGDIAASGIVTGAQQVTSGGSIFAGTAGVTGFGLTVDYLNGYTVLTFAPQKLLQWDLGSSVYRFTHEPNLNSVEIYPYVNGPGGSVLQVVQGPVRAFGPYQDFSDIRSKQHVQPATYGLSEILALNPVSFAREGSDHREIGFIAQDVLPILPEIVAPTAGPDEMLALRSSSFIPVLVNAVKELYAEVVALKGGSSGVLPSKR
jgi:hypothetical protein